jgi:hypothetical protein
MHELPLDRRLRQILRDDRFLEDTVLLWIFQRLDDGLGGQSVLEGVAPGLLFSVLGLWAGARESVAAVCLDMDRLTWWSAHPPLGPSPRAEGLSPPRFGHCRPDRGLDRCVRSRPASFLPQHLGDLDRIQSNAAPPGSLIAGTMSRGAALLGGFGRGIEVRRLMHELVAQSGRGVRVERHPARISAIPPGPRCFSEMPASRAELDKTFLNRLYRDLYIYEVRRVARNSFRIPR